MSLPGYEKVLGARAAMELANWRQFGNIYGEGYDQSGNYIGVQAVGAPAMNEVIVDPVASQEQGYYNGVTVPQEFGVHGQEM